MMIMLALLFVKHYVIDFVMQTDAMVKSKGIYGDPQGVWHSAQQGFGTFLVALPFVTTPFGALFVGVLDFVLHYHIDWLKMNKGCRDITNPLFWNHLGLDQLAHALTYIVIVCL